jgi:hypothetical protein
LRQASEPLTTRDIALQLLVERALDKSDQRLEVPAVTATDLILPPPTEGSAEVAARVAARFKPA